MYLKSTLIYLNYIILASCLVTLSAGDLRSDASHLPKDYAHVASSSRVKDLVTFFEILDRTNKRTVEQPSEINVILSLTESASKLYTLSHGLPLANKCNLYVKLLSRPNIRTVATISELLREQPSFDEIQQPDANLVARLTSERQFDALARIQTLIQTLDSERTLGAHKSNFEAAVHKDLLDCINYLAYRHQHALQGAISYARESAQRLARSLVAASPAEIVIGKFAQLIEQIKSVELRGGLFNHQDWLQSLTKLQMLATKNNYEVPILVVKFLAEPTRVKRLNVLMESEQLESILLEAESKSPLTTDEESECAEALARLRELCEAKDVELPASTCDLLKDARRVRLLEEKLVGEKIRAKDEASEEIVRSAAFSDTQLLGNINESFVGHGQDASPLDVSRPHDRDSARLLTTHDQAAITPSLDAGLKSLGEDELAEREAVPADPPSTATSAAATGGSWTRWLKMPEPILQSAQKAGQSLRVMAPSVRLWPNKLWSYVT